MGLPNMPNLGVSGQVRARDIQMAGVADMRRRVLMISGAIVTPDHDISLSVNLPEPGRWQVIKSETNLTDQTWTAIQVTTDEESSFVNDAETLVLSRQFAKMFMTPDQQRLTFYDGEVRSGDSLLKVYTLETSSRRPVYTYSQYSPIGSAVAADPDGALERLVADGLPSKPVIELTVPVMVIG